MWGQGVGGEGKQADTWQGAGGKEIGDRKEVRRQEVRDKA